MVDDPDCCFVNSEGVSDLPLPGLMASPEYRTVGTGQHVPRETTCTIHGKITGHGLNNHQPSSFLQGHVMSKQKEEKGLCLEQKECDVVRSALCRNPEEILSWAVHLVCEQRERKRESMEKSIREIFQCLAQQVLGSANNLSSSGSKLF